jgi:hypothetical protein
LDLAGQNGKQPVKITIYRGNVLPKVPVLAGRQSGLAGANMDLPAASGRWENSVGTPALNQNSRHGFKFQHQTEF